MPITLKKPLILASASPRRQQLLQEAGVPFTVQPSSVEETYPDHFQVMNIPIHLAEKKALDFKDTLGDQLVLAADTIVTMDSQVLEKPANRQEAKAYLDQLSGRSHTVITGVCLLTATTQESFYEATEVSFRTLSPEEIAYYIDTYEPYDKAGAYGIQEWIGVIGVESVNGSYWNVMGLPMESVFKRLKTTGGLAISQP